MTLPTPAITFVIPAYNAAKTLEMPLRSLQAQTRQDWQAVIVDDGSSDATYEVAQGLAGQDSRIKVLTRENGGVSAARNTGVEAADAPYICLLDADDWLDKCYIERMLAPLTDARRPVATYCSYRRVVDSGELPIEWTKDLTGDNARRELSSYCVLAVFCVVFRKVDYQRIGGMNTALQTCEDWEFWLRLAFDNVDFLEIRECLGFYYNRTGSLSKDMLASTRDAIQVLTLAHALNTARFGTPALTSANSLPFVYVVSWFAGWQAGAGKPVGEILKMLSPMPDCSGQEAVLADIIMKSLRLGLQSSDFDALCEKSALWEPHVDEIFHTFETAGYPGMARNLWAELTDHILRTAPPAGPWHVAHIRAFAIDLHDVPDIIKPASADTVIVAIQSKGRVSGLYTAPMWGHFGAASMAEALAHFPLLAVKKLTRNPLTLVGFSSRLAISLLKDSRLLAKILLKEGDRKKKLKMRLTALVRQILKTQPIVRPGTEDGLSIAQARVAAISASFIRPMATAMADTGPTDRRQIESDLPPDEAAYWEDIFAQPDPWNYLSLYETTKYHQTIDILGDEPVGRAMEVACAEGIFTRMIHPHVDSLLAVDISTRALERARKRCADLDGISFDTYNLITDTPPEGLDLIVCSEVLYYLDGASRLREIAAKFSAALKDGGRFVTAHAHQLTDEPHRTGYEWGDSFGVGTIRDVFADTPGLVLEKSMESELYAIHSFRKTTAEKAATPIVMPVNFGKPLEPDVARHVIWGGIAKSRADAMASEMTGDIPVLMYHRIADDGPAGLAPYRTSPADFDAQLCLLRRHGYYTLSAADLNTHLRLRQPVPGRPVVITFDDAYADFASHAFPILESNDFTADVFVVTGKAGQTSDWDKVHGVAPLMDWPEIERLSKLGIRFGSHMESHTSAAALGSEALLDEALRSKLTLEQKLGKPVSSIAMPYGVFDARVEQVLELCGYETAFSTEHGLAHLDSPRLHLPRLEVYGGLSLDEFARMVGIKS